jgi:TRAP-type C4-dicarboxylate transport system substrate-binding protein
MPTFGNRGTLSRAGALACLSGLLALSAQAATQWEFSSIMPPGNFAAEHSLRFAEAVKEATGGEVTINVHLGGALGLKGPETLVAVQDGIVHVADMQMNQQIGEDKFFGIESVPFLATGFVELRVLQGFTRPHFDEIAKQHNQKILYIYPFPPQNLHANTATDTSVDQFAGIKVRTIDKNATDFFTALGAVPLQMPWAEVIPALSTGVIDAVSTSATSGVDGKFWEFMTHVNELHWQMNSFMVSVNLDAWNAISPEHQDIIEEIAERMEPEIWTASFNDDAASIATLEENGMTITQPSPELKQQLNEVGESMWQAAIEEIGPRAEEVIGRYRQMVGK